MIVDSHEELCVNVQVYTDLNFVSCISDINVMTVKIYLGNSLLINISKNISGNSSFHAEFY
jgi:hypothetical protein